MQIDVRDRQWQNAVASIRSEREPPSKATDESCEQQLKQLSQSDVTDEGIRIDRSDTQSEKTRWPICESDEPHSNSNRGKCLQPAKEL
jgi:hypothetical protein